ncbi:MAG: ABC transporter substrate-binding protein [Clostridiales bacterium]|nr:ABC transporter substrate-binding protein [Clostridiales bacterium]
MRKRITATLLAAMMALSTAACGGQGQTQSSGGNDTIVIGSVQWNGVFSPFFYDSSYDSQIFSLTQETVLETNANNELIDNLGHIDEEVVGKGDNQKTIYTIKLNDGVKFSDGSDVTIDDLIFTYKVLADPNYDGMDTFRTTVNIEGINEYYYDDPNYSEKLDQVNKQAEEYSKDKEKFIEYLVDTKCEDMFTEVGQDPDGEDGPLTSWTDYLKDKGFEISEADAKDEAKLLKALAECEYETNKDSYDALSYYEEKLSKDLVADGLSDGIDVTEISGIERVDDLTCKVTVNGVDMNALRTLGLEPVVPSAYYGEGFEKGNLEGVKDKNDKPMGTGPYVFVSNKDNVVKMEANENYRLGTPKTKYVAFQVVESDQMADGIINGDIDIATPPASTETVEKMDNAGVHYDLFDNNGYSYAAISAKRIPDKNVREGLMHLMTREQAISTYYGKLAQVIERPMTTILPEYPQDAKEYWGYDPEKALECFKKAGYEQKNGKLVKNGKQLVVEVGVSDASTSPVTPIFTQMKNDMEKMGAKLNITDVNFSILLNRVNSDDIDMWTMGWGNSQHCDLTQLFGSEYTKNGGSNRTWIKDKKLDQLLEEVRSTLDVEKRKELVAEELDLIMSWATYMPLFQRKNMMAYSSNINLDTLPKEQSMFYNYVNEIEKLELNQ